MNTMDFEQEKTDFDYDIDERPSSDPEEREEAEKVKETLRDSIHEGTRDLNVLLGEVQGLRPVFEGTIAFCREPKRGAEVDEEFARLTEYNHSTYSAVMVRAMLEQTGALEYVIDETLLPEPVNAEIGEDNDEYYVITKKPEGLWVATEKGLEVIDSKNGVEEVKALFGEEDSFVEVYKCLLQALNQTPKSIVELDALINDEPVMVATRRRASALVKKLEERLAVEYRGKWEITEIGRQILAEM